MSNYVKLKTNLKLAIQRLKLLEKKKTELSLKSRKEIADYITANKADRARIRVEHIIREDNYVEAMEMLEMFCDLLLARFGLIEKMKELDPGLDEAIATVIWSSPRVSNEIAEFKIIGEILAHKYGKKYADACKMDTLNNVNEKVKKRLGLEAPSKLLVEQYLIEIAKNFNVPYDPDNSVMLRNGIVDEELISLKEKTNEIQRRYGGNNGGASGGGGSEAASAYPSEKRNIGFDDQEKKSGNNYMSDLIDLNDHDINNNNYNNNQNYSNYEKKPGLPNSIPFGNVFNPPPPSYNTASYANNTVHSLPPYDQNSHDRAFNTTDEFGYPNAPPLPSKNTHAENDSLRNDNYEKARPPSYQFENNQKSNNLLDDDLGLPSVPDTFPNNHKDQGSKPNQDDFSVSNDFDELTKRFQNLKNK